MSAPKHRVLYLRPPHSWRATRIMSLREAKVEAQVLWDDTIASVVVKEVSGGRRRP